MIRFILVCALCVLCVVGCSKAPDSANQNASKPAVSPSATPAGQTTTTPANMNTSGSTGADKNAQSGDVTGAYFPKGTLPAEFSEIEHLNLANIDEDSKPAPLNGFIRPKKQSAKDYKLVSPTLTGKDLTFTTDTVNGVSYSFKGTFEKLDDFAENPPPTDEVILKGTLTKMSGGKSVAETKVNLTYSAGG